MFYYINLSKKKSWKVKNSGSSRDLKFEDDYSMFLFYSQNGNLLLMNFPPIKMASRRILFVNSQYRPKLGFQNTIQLITILYWRKFLLQQVAISGFKKNLPLKTNKLHWERILGCRSTRVSIQRKLGSIYFYFIWKYL